MKSTMKNTMKKVTLAAFAFIIGALFLSTLTLQTRATTIDECIAAINVVQGDLAGVVIGGNNPDQTRASLNSKLSGAILKLRQGKFADALQKLNDFTGKVNDLMAQNKISDGTTMVTDLQKDAQAAIVCVHNLLSGN